MSIFCGVGERVVYLIVAATQTQHMSYQLKDFNRNIPDQELLDNLKRVAEKIGVNKLSSREYNLAHGEMLLKLSFNS